ncbi:hypothetical protein V1J52_22070 [Streptomyces sp. TRM 70351]|uniref:hypothetical protein n=1 Tax=Streptomyces sp. TRM 70351 TaxID=3116552 RepID=UPI002E7B19E5|nr:hypothetical protein [Streptomyces sp. TRM 70351]MEE1930836.1 hypothetical protein [Streptomyces sp. TRM 70351]
MTGKTAPPRFFGSPPPFLAKLSRVRQSILDMCGSAKVSIFPVDLSDPSSVQRMVDGIPEGRHVDVVHSAGLGAANYKIPDDNPYLPVERTPTVSLPRSSMP